ncbi:MAG: UDP-N-acetylmuramate dehydrogenase [Candidatus Berkelbacteria bacterium]|nr:UDP-N-acetylmuramate dehydrogenase [Candidatus Berkelbacteria bacterium]
MGKDSIIQKLKRILGDELVENEPLAEHSTLKIGGAAQYFYRAKSISNLILAIETCLKFSIPYIVLGSGSNVIIGDGGFSGLCIKNEARNLSFIKDKSQVITDSGVALSRLILEAASHDMGGLDFLYGIPGTVGGSVVSNAGTFGGAIGDFVISATLLFPNGKAERVTKKWLMFEYRDSKLRHLNPRPVVLSVKFQLATNRKEEILRKVQHFQRIRESKQPIENSAGSFFKNPEVSKQWAKKYLDMFGEKNPDLVEAIEKTGHIPAGWLLEQSGAKKMKIKAARVSKKHANFIVNHRGKAKAAEIRKLAGQLKQKVYDKFGIMLQEEVEYVGDWS